MNARRGCVVLALVAGACLICWLAALLLYFGLGIATSPPGHDTPLEGVRIEDVPLLGDLSEPGAKAAASPTARSPGAAAEASGRARDGGVPAGPAAEGGPVEGGVLLLAGADPTTLDPAVVRDVVSAEYICEIFSGLVSLSSDLEVVPDLASGWEVDATGTAYTFTLESDLRFHDGRPASSRDVVYSIERACDPATASLVAETYLGDIVGCSEKLQGGATQVSGVSAPDDGHVVIEIEEPIAYFLSKLTYPTSFVVDAAQIEADPQWALRPNGTGPFALESWRREEELVLRRNPTYHGSTAHLDRVQFDLRPMATLTLYENGELDAVPVGPASLERVRDPLNPLSAEVVEAPSDLGITYLGFNVTRAPFDDVHVRRAFNMALDKDLLARVVLRDAVSPADWIVPPGLPAHNPDASPYEFDVEAAREELAASRFGSADALPPITLNAAGGLGGNTSAEVVADMIGETLGITIEVECATWDLYQQEVAAGTYAVYHLGWSADYPDPQDFLDVLFHSASPLNHTGYENPEVDRLLEAARTETDDGRRWELYRRAEALILEDAPWLPLYSALDTWLVAPYVRGFEASSVVVPRLANVWLEP